MANPAFPWPFWTAAWPWSLFVARVVHWGFRAGLDRGSGGVREGTGGCVRRSIAGVSSRGCWGVL